MHKTYLLGAADWQLAVAEELHHVWHTVERLAELSENVATIATDDLYVQNSATASDTSKLQHIRRLLYYQLVMQRYIVQTIYRVDIGHIVSYRYRQEKYRNFDISLSFRYHFNIGETTSMLSIYFLFCR